MWQVVGSISPVRTWTLCTMPRTRRFDPISMVLCSVHSRATGASAMRGVEMLEESRRVRVSVSISLWP